MPEGDTIHRIARTLAPLVGKTLERVTTQGLVRDLAGRTVASVDAHGKHLVIELDASCTRAPDSRAERAERRSQATGWASQ